MHILIATPYLPWPLNAGGNVAQFSTLECLSKDHFYTIVCPIHSQKQCEWIERIEELLPHVRVKAVPLYNDIIPTSYSRLRDFLRSGLNFIRQLILSNERANLKAITHYPYYPFNPLPVSFINALIKEIVTNNVDILQVEFAEMLSLSALKTPNIPKIFINHQIHWVYANRYLNVNEFDPYSEYLANQIFAQESVFLSGFDSIIVFSEVDAKEMSTVVDKHKIHISPFPIPSDLDITVPNQNKNFTRENFTFVGSEAHVPNQDALEWLLSDIWPLIRASLPDSQLFAIGNWGEEWCSSHQSEGVVYTGFVENINQVMQGTIQLVPVRIGSGIRTKILTAMALEVPVVSTTIGIEGIKVCNLEHALVRDTAHDFACGAIMLAKDSTLANHLATKALDFVNTNYSHEVVRKTRNIIYETVMLSP